MTAQRPFVGRRHVLDATKAALDGGDHARLREAVGVYGAGKTTLLRKVHEHVGGPANTVAIHLEIDNYALHDAYREDELAAAREAFEAATHVMTWLATRTGSAGHFDDYAVARQAARNSVSSVNLRIENRQKAGWRGQILDSGQDIDISFSREKVIDDLRAATSSASDAFVASWRRWANRKAVLLTVDGFEHVIDEELGRWFVKVSGRLRNTLVMLTRLPSQSLGLPPGRALTHRLNNFNRSEIGAFLAQTLERGPLEDGVVDIVHQATGGHPGGVDLAATLLAQLGEEALDVPGVAAVFRDLPDDASAKWVAMVETILAGVRDHALRAAVDACSVLRRFDGTAVRDLVGAEMGGGEQRSIEVLESLERHGLSERVDAVGERQTASFRVEGFIREGLNRKAATLDPRRRDTLHRRAAKHYFGLLSEIEEDDEALSYGAWYRYEDPRWQELKREWLYHIGHTATRRRDARLQFSKVFLDAFWWWGYYFEFDFCRRLLEDWHRVSRDVADAVVLESLQTLLDHYPTGFRKPPGPHWTTVRQALLRLRDDALGLAPARAGLKTGNERHVAALVDVFLAHVRRYQDPSDRKADRYYADALALFEQTGDRWNVSWMGFEVADLWIERGEPEQARPSCARAAAIQLAMRRAGDKPDEEITANLHRTWADAAWMAGDRDGAADGYGRAVLHAYLFQGVPHPPDGYTRRFYEEVLERVGGQLDELGRSDPDQANTMAKRIGAASGLGWPLPEPPLDGELYLSSSAFMDRWRDTHEEVAGAATGDLALLAPSP